MSQLLSQEMLAVADSLNHIRAQLTHLLAQGKLPADMFRDASTVLVQGFDVTLALRGLAEAPVNRDCKDSAYDPSERR